MSTTPLETHELEIAREIQSRLFPGYLRHIMGLDYYGDCQPASEVGGDFFDFIPRGHEALFVSIGDVAGRGYGAAILMAGLQSFLRGLTSARCPEISSVAQDLNRIAYDVCPDNLYATLFYACVDPLRRRLCYVSAGHEPALLVRMNSSRIERLESTGTVLGLKRDIALRTRTVRLEPGDVLVAFTDGITEALDTEGRELCDTGVLEIVRRWPDARACDLVGEIMQAAGWLPAYSMPDDRTVIVVRYTAAAERSFYERRTRTTFALAAA